MCVPGAFWSPKLAESVNCRFNERPCLNEWDAEGKKRHLTLSSSLHSCASMFMQTCKYIALLVRTSPPHIQRISNTLHSCASMFMQMCRYTAPLVHTSPLYIQRIRNTNVTKSFIYKCRTTFFILGKWTVLVTCFPLLPEFPGQLSPILNI